MDTSTRRPDRFSFGLALAGGTGLAAAAGFVDAVVLAQAGYAVTHVTGAAANLATDLALNKPTLAGAVLSVLASFMLGAGIAGLLIGESGLRIGRRYGLAMLLEAALLTAAALFLTDRVLTGACLAAAAAGLQNGMASTYAGLIVRTTHLTGIATDLGFLAGSWLRTRSVEAWRFLMLAALMSGFLLGAGVGAIAQSELAERALFIPAGVLCCVGLTYFLWRRANRAA